MIVAGAIPPLVLADMWWGDGWGVVWIGVMAAFWIAVIIGIVVLIRSIARGPTGVGGPPALKVLEERYARGEVTREEFLERRAVLTNTGTSRQT